MCLLKVQDLTIISNNLPLPLLNRIHFKIKTNRITAMIGESGAGKTIFSRTISGLLPNGFKILSGEFFFNGERIGYKWLKKNRKRKIFYVPQNATASLNPVIKIKNQIDEIGNLGKKKITNILCDLSISDPDRILNSYPFELSGGESQLCILTMAIALSPLLLVLDEPVTALDISAQKDFMRLLKKIQRKLQLTVLILSHNLEMIGHIAEYLYVIWNGSIVDEGYLENIVSCPTHFYTRQITGYF
jgi:peptide/nickel transport system ATP-binding protein